MTVVTAAQGDQFASWDEDAKHGLFTKHLLEALNGKADTEDYGNGDGKVTLGELQTYLDDEMTYQARRRYNRDQKGLDSHFKCNCEVFEERFGGRLIAEAFSRC